MFNNDIFSRGQGQFTHDANGNTKAFTIQKHTNTNFTIGVPRDAMDPIYLGQYC